MSSTSSSPSSGNPSRRSRAANRIISLAGLGGAKASSGQSASLGSSNTFPSFRFSPESDEVREVTFLSDDPPIDINGDPVPLSGSLPPSPKPGETSPIKDYIRKNWTNKWDKKSLSLDLDLRGKIKGVIEDKRKSIVSHFIPEEAGLAPATESYAYESSTQRLTHQSASLPEEYEEIGVDFLACLEEESVLDDLLASDQVDMAQLSWTCPPGSVTEKFEGVVSNVEVTAPGQRSPEPPMTWGQQAVKLLESTLMKICIALLAAALLLPIGSFGSALLGLAAGIAGTVVVMEAMRDAAAQDSPETAAVSSRSSTPTNGVDLQLDSALSFSKVVTATHKTIQLSPKCQGWMLEFDGFYNPGVITFQSAESVFVRLDARLLYISTPAPKHRVPKRRLWSDAPLTHDTKFVRHRIYDISGAQIFIAPERLASKRVWNKKYPIGIRLLSSSHYWQVTRVNEVPGATPALPTPSESTAADNGAKEKEAQGTPTAQRRSSPTLVKSDKEFVQKSSDGKILYLFSRTCREKDDWFRRLVNASKMAANGVVSENGVTAAVQPDLQDDYLRYMANILPNFESSLRESAEVGGGAKSCDKLKSSTSVESDDSATSAAPEPISSSQNSPELELLDVESILSQNQSPAFLNALLGRLLYDAVRSPYWSLQLQNMIQRKLNFIKRPPFVELLIVKDLDLGGSFPIIQRASTPIFDSRGLWIDFDVTYDGNFCQTLEAKINLLKLRRSPTAEEEPTSGLSAQAEDNGSTDGMDLEATPVGNCYDSEAEDSGESSEEEFDSDSFLKAGEDESEEVGGSTVSTPPTVPKRARLLKMVEKVATSNFVSEMKMVKSAIGRVANTPLLLTVEVKSLYGTVTVNVPPPPSNRVWIGFRTKPVLKLVTTPRVGDRQVNLTPLTDWIQRKIHQQIQRSLVLPNMDDLTIRLMEFKLPS